MKAPTPMKGRLIQKIQVHETRCAKPPMQIGLDVAAKHNINELVKQAVSALSLDAQPPCVSRFAYRSLYIDGD